jgi:hypothetical protein
VTDGEIVDVEFERGGKRGRLRVSHVSFLANMNTSKQATRDTSVANPCRLCDRSGC